jgi:hypothetical protein
LPGQSAQEELDRILESRILLPIVLTASLLFLALIEWMWLQSIRPPNPWFATALALLALVFSAITISRARRQLRSLRLARDGERVVAEQMDTLKQQGAAVIHDVVAGKFNIDHVILSTKGVFVAETKTRSKPLRGSPTVTYDGEVLLVDGFKPERDPIAQAQANARWVADALRASTGKAYPVRPVVLFPGWFVEPCPRSSDVWVLEPKALPSFIENENTKIADEDLHLAVYHLSRIARARAP